MPDKLATRVRACRPARCSNEDDTSNGHAFDDWTGGQVPKIAKIKTRASEMDGQSVCAICLSAMAGRPTKLVCARACDGDELPGTFRNVAGVVPDTGEEPETVVEACDEHELRQRIFAANVGAPVALPCGHAFHRHCLLGLERRDHRAGRRTQCPTCRANAAKCAAGPLDSSDEEFRYDEPEGRVTRGVHGEVLRDDDYVPPGGDRSRPASGAERRVTRSQAGAGGLRPAAVAAAAACVVAAAAFAGRRIAAMQ